MTFRHHAAHSAQIGSGRLAAAAALALVVCLGQARTGSAADQDALVQQMTTLNKAAIAAYSAGDFDKSKSQLLQAVALGKKEPQLLSHPMMARTYVHLGVLYVDGFEEHDEGLAYFVKALKIRPDIEPTSALVTQTVKSAFDQAKSQAGTASAGAVAGASAGGAGAGAGGHPATIATAPGAAAPSAAPASTSGSGGAAAEEKPAPKLTAAEKKKAAAEEKRAAAEEKKRLAEEAKQAAVEAKRAAAEAKEKEKEDRKDNTKLRKELGVAQGSEAKERAAKDKLQAEKAEKEKALTETKASLEKVQKETAEKEKQAQAEKEKAAKELAQLKESEAKEKAAKDKLQAEKAEADKQLAEAKAAIAQLQKDKAEKDKQLGETAAREKKEREAKEKLEKEKQLAEAREKERRDTEEKQRQAREKLAAGPEVPSHIARPIYCDIPDDAEAGADLFVHCISQPNLKDKEIVLFYRPSGGNHFNSLALEPSKKGWRAAMIPADRLTGKVLQYYVEVRDSRGTAAADGKPSSPNILTLKPAGAVASRGPTVTTTKRR